MVFSDLQCANLANIEEGDIWKDSNSVLIASSFEES